MSDAPFDRELHVQQLEAVISSLRSELKLEKGRAQDRARVAARDAMVAADDAARRARRCYGWLALSVMVNLVLSHHIYLSARATAAPPATRTRDRAEQSVRRGAARAPPRRERASNVPRKEPKLMKFNFHM